MKRIKLEVEVNIPDYWLESNEPTEDVKKNIANDIVQRLGAFEVEGQKMNCAYTVIKLDEVK